MQKSLIQKIRSIVILMAFALISSAVPSSADARPKPTRPKSKKFESNKIFGIGLMLGLPSGVTGKYYLGKDTAIDFGIGSYQYGYRDKYRSSLDIHADFLWHPIVLASPKAFWLPLYFGVGARVLDHRWKGYGESHIDLGVRVPVGVLFDFNKIPLDAFVEFALVVDVLRDSGHSYSDIHHSVGARYYFY